MSYTRKNEYVETIYGRLVFIIQLYDMLHGLETPKRDLMSMKREASVGRRAIRVTEWVLKAIEDAGIPLSYASSYMELRIAVRQARVAQARLQLQIQFYEQFR